MTSLWGKVARRALLLKDRLRYEVIQKDLSWSDVDARLRNDVRGRFEGPEPYKRLYEYWVGENPRLPRVYQVDRERSRRYAALLDKRIPLFGREYRYPDEVHSQKEPVFGVEWPSVYVQALSDFRPGSDLVLFWEFNKMMFLLDVSFACRAEGDPRFARLWLEWVRAWTKSNPFMVGMNWRSPLEAGTRLVVWSIGLREIAAVGTPGEAELAAIVNSMIRQAEFLASRLSFRPISNNHLIGDAATLYFFSVMWPMFERAAAWEKQALEILAQEIERQILPDGMDFENAFNYHAYVLDFYLLYIYGCILADRNPRDAILTGTRKIARSYLSSLSPSGRVPRIGDESISEFFVLEAPRSLETRQFGDEIRLRDVVRAELVERFEERVWGDQLINTAARLELSAHLPVSGFTMVRKRDSHLVFTAGPTHDAPFASGHLHADAASFELEIAGTPVFIDSGTYLYFHDTGIRTHFKSARAHNTVIVDGVEPMESTHSFAWRDVPRSRTAWFSNALCSAVACSHVLPSRGALFRHERVMVHLGGHVWVIADRLRVETAGGEAEAPLHHEATLFFHTPFGGGDFTTGGGKTGTATTISVPVTGGDRIELVVDGFSSTTYESDLVTDPDDKLTWYSFSYGELLRGATIRARAEFDTDLTVAHAVYAAGNEVDGSVLEAGDVGFTITGDTGERRRLTVGFAPFRLELDGEPFEEWSRS